MSRTNNYTPTSKIPRESDTGVIMDIEGTGLSYLNDYPFALAIQINGIPYVAKWDENIVDWIVDNAPGFKASIFHNAKFDLHQFIQGGVPIETIRKMQIHDTMLTEAILDEHQKSYSLDNLARRHLGKSKSSGPLIEKLAELFGGKADKKTQMPNLHKAPPAVSVPYALDDVILTGELYEKHLKEIDPRGLTQIYDLEMEVVIALMEMERRGVPVDLGRVPIVKEQLETQLHTNEQKIIELVGNPVNTNSPKQMLLAWEKLGLDIALNDGGNPTFAKDILETVKHPFPALVLESRSIRKSLDTFIANMDKFVHDGRMYTNFNQLRNGDYGTGTGRLSSSEPNLQQIPKRDKKMAEILRGLFAPINKDEKWICGDWSQFEFRLFAHYSGDEVIKEKYRNDPKTDFHQAVSDLTGVKRNPTAKQINLGMVFGMGQGKLAQELKLPYTKERGRNGKMFLKPGPEALAIFNQYHSSFPRARALLNEASIIAQNRGYIRTILNRHIHFPNGMGAHKAGGLIFQGSAADLMKKKLVEMNKVTADTEVELLLSVHDEFDFVAPKNVADEAVREIKAIMEDMPEVSIPIIADVKSDINWWEASK